MDVAFSTTALTPLNTPTVHKGGGTLAVLGIVAAIAIPFAAPAIAAALSTSTALAATSFGAFMGTAGGAALTGAVLGGGLAAATGGNILRGAALGGIGSGISAGLSYGGFANPALSGAGTAASPMVAAGQASASGAAGMSTQAIDTNFAGLTNAPMASLPTAGTAADPLAGILNTGAAQTSFATPSGMIVNGAAFSPTASVVPASGLPTSGVIQAGVRSIPGKIEAAAGKAFKSLTDPSKLADRAIQFGLNKVANATFDPSAATTPQERALMEQQTAALGDMRARDAASFGLKMQGAKSLMGQSAYYDPTYFGQQRATASRNASARAAQAGLRAIGPDHTGQRAAEARRYALGAARTTGTAFDQGFQSGVTNQTRVLNAGVSAIPTPSGGYLNSLAQYGTGQADIYNREAKLRRNNEQFWAGFGS